MESNVDAAGVAMRHVFGILASSNLGVRVDASWPVDQTIDGVLVSHIGQTRPQAELAGFRFAELVPMRVLISRPGEEFGAIADLVARTRSVLDRRSDVALGVYDVRHTGSIAQAVPTRSGESDMRCALLIEVLVGPPS